MNSASLGPVAPLRRMRFRDVGFHVARVSACKLGGAVIACLAVTIPLAAQLQPPVALPVPPPPVADGPQPEATTLVDTTGPQPAGAKSTRNLELIVRDAATDRPIPEVTVQAPFLEPNRRILGIPIGRNRSLETDTNGSAILKIPGRNDPRSSAWHNVSLRHPDYGPVDLSWMDGPPPNGFTPTQEVVHLHRTQTIGGRVQDESGRPVGGARIQISGSLQQFESYNPGTQRIRQSASYYGHGTDNKMAVTDAAGHWEVSDFPPNLNQVQVRVILTNNIQISFATRIQEMASYDAREIRREDLFATNAVLGIPNPVSLRGVVVDMQGRPVPGAAVLEGYGLNSATENARTLADSDGRFEFANRRPRQVALTAVAPGYALQSTVVNFTTNSPEARLVLSPARPLKVRAVRPDGRPLANAQWSTVYHRNPGQVLAWSDSAEDDGRITWSNAPLDGVVLAISTGNRIVRTVKLAPSDQEQVVTIPPGTNRSVRVTGRVTDTAGKPIDRFQVFQNVPWSQETRLFVSGTNGAFQGDLLIPENSYNNGIQFQLFVRAPGHQQWTSGSIEPTDVEVALTAALMPTGDPAGMVLLADGRPAAGATFYLLENDWSSVYMQGAGNFSKNNEVRTVVAGRDGRFNLGDSGSASRAVIGHKEGVLTTTLDELRKTNVVRLAAFGRIEGRLPTSATFDPRFYITLGSVGQQPLQYSPTIQPDATGRFAYSNVPPGDYVLRRYRPRRYTSTQFSHSLPITVRAGETTEVNYSLGGREVTGQLEVDGTVEVEWPNTDPLLIARNADRNTGLVAPSTEDFVRQADYQAANQAFWRQNSHRLNQGASGQFVLAVNADGGFRVSDIPPGRYELQVRVTEPPPKDRRQGYYGNQPELGRLVREVVIPPAPANSAEPADLGTFTVKVRSVDLPTTPAPPLQLTALDGRSFDLSSLKGRPAVLCFWTSWAPQSSNQLAQLAALRRTYPPDAAAWVTVNVDDPLERVRREVAAWPEATHLALEPAQRVAVADAWELDVLPTIVLIDADGRIARRGASGRSLGPILRRMITATAKP